ncbi:VRR-NUC domain-containing protein [Corynebacterium belfantii]|uniref:VRR-NUC domain-containing protein n=1 Tax=Corynebacterium belfantii TaxID=2014537 RepID=UPI0018D41B54|nr:VRR-NUC domain-containing protein [Corynebacterium belfantii]MBG9319424.1 VRR-NUC domain-containing protein [Corynebacterium belfantii]
MKEKHLENELKKTVEAIGGICWKLVSPGVSGVPDRICLKAGRVIFVELKAPGKRPRPIQNHRIKQLRDHGFQAFVVDSPDGIAEVTDALQAA